ncbi:MAG: CFI-box-CTERM domain-containing protein [Pirellulaceae bacterium]
MASSNSNGSNKVEITFFVMPSKGENRETVKKFVDSSELPGLYCCCHGCQEISLLNSRCTSCGYDGQPMKGVSLPVFHLKDANSGGKGWFCTQCGTGYTKYTCDCGTYNTHPTMKWVDAEGKVKECFVATVCFGNPDHRVVEELRLFRDQVLKSNRMGRAFVDWYYRHGPALASAIKKFPLFHPPIRLLLFTVSLLSCTLGFHSKGKRSGNAPLK